jgi:hypothetical protein
MPEAESLRIVPTTRLDRFLARTRPATPCLGLDLDVVRAGYIAHTPDELTRLPTAALGQFTASSTVSPCCTAERYRIRWSLNSNHFGSR